MVRYIFIFLGILSLIAGIIGIVVPGLPTTPFILLTAGLFVRSSDRLYEKLIGSKVVGRYVRIYRKQKGMTLWAKLLAIGTMWTMIALSEFLFLTNSVVQVSVLLLGVIGTLVMGFVVPTAKPTTDI